MKWSGCFRSLVVVVMLCCATVSLGDDAYLKIVQRYADKLIADVHVIIDILIRL